MRPSPQVEEESPADVLCTTHEQVAVRLRQHVNPGDLAIEPGGCEQHRTGGYQFRESTINLAYVGGKSGMHASQIGSFQASK